MFLIKGDMTYKRELTSFSEEALRLRHFLNLWQRYKRSRTSEPVELESAKLNMISYKLVIERNMFNKGLKKQVWFVQN